jgi:hypothetical protein
MVAAPADETSDAQGEERDAARRSHADDGAIHRRDGRPITLRIDDRPPLVVEDERVYRLLWELVDRAETIEAVRDGLEQVRQGRTRPLEEVDRHLRKKHGIQRLRSPRLLRPKSATRISGCESDRPHLASAGIKA